MKSIPFEIFLKDAENISKFNPEIIKKIESNLGLSFTDEKTNEGNVCLANSHEVRPEFKETFTSIDLQDYIYSILQSETNSKNNKAFSEKNPPIIPISRDNVKFWKLVQLGRELRSIHLFETEPINQCKIRYTADGYNIVTKIKFEIIDENSIIEKLGCVYINENQYFDNVPEVAWKFCIKNEQIAKKWLENYKGLKLTFEDILHYQKIIIVLSETYRIQKEINNIGI